MPGGSLGSSIPTFDFNLSELPTEEYFTDYGGSGTGAPIHIAGTGTRPTSRGLGDARQVVFIEASEVEAWINNLTAQLPRAVANSIKRRVVSEATDYYLAQLKARTPQFDTGNLRKSMTRVIRQYARRGRRGNRGANKYYLGVVGPDVITGPHAHLVEYGTTDRYTRRGYYRGRMPPKAFFEAIFQTSITGGLRVIEAAMQRELSREFDKLGQGKPVTGT